MATPQHQSHYLSDIDLSRRYGVTRQCVWRWVHREDFPHPIKLSPGCTRWRMSDIELWEQSRGRA